MRRTLVTTLVYGNRLTRAPLRQILAFHQLHDEREHTAGFFKAIDVRDVRVVQ